MPESMPETQLPACPPAGTFVDTLKATLINLMSATEEVEIIEILSALSTIVEAHETTDPADYNQCLDKFTEEKLSASASQQVELPAKTIREFVQYYKVTCGRPLHPDIEIWLGAPQRQEEVPALGIGPTTA